MTKGKNLTIETIMIRTKCDKLNAIKNLNLWGNDLEDISCVSSVPNLEVISLAVNKIKTLKPFSKLTYLRELYMRKNNISNMNEVSFLKDCFSLKTLTLNENPISDNPNYRKIVIKTLPQLIKLDDKVISSDERNNTEIGDEDYEDYNEKEYDQEQEEDTYEVIESKRNIVKKKSDNNIAYHRQVLNQEDDNDSPVYKNYHNQKSDIPQKRQLNIKYSHNNDQNEESNELTFKNKQKKSVNEEINKQTQVQAPVQAKLPNIKNNRLSDNSDDSVNLIQQNKARNKKECNQEAQSDSSNTIKAIEYLLETLSVKDLYILNEKVKDKIKTKSSTYDDY